jgi:hypothetical protein
MKIDKPFNTLTKNEYLLYIPEHKKYSDFNTLGLYRSLLENEKLSIEQKIEVRDIAHQNFFKTFEFLQLKDPRTYLEVSTLGQEMTVADERQAWEDIRTNQEKIIKEKKLNHRNFGQYSKHNCGYEDCPMNGIMIKEGSWMAEWHMRFDSDSNEYAKQEKSERRKKDRKNKHQIINENLELD